MRRFEGYEKGVNLGGWLSQLVGTDDRHFSSFITEKDIAQIAEWGLDHVRLPIDCDVVFKDMGRRVGPRMRYVDDCVNWCEKYGLRMVLDLHKTYGYMFDTAVVSDPDLFFEDEELQQAFYRIWETLAQCYGNKPERVAFELLNEVTNPAQAQKWNSIAAKCVQAVRKYAKDTYILIGGVMNNHVTSVPLLDPPVDGHIVYNFHCYEPLAFTHQQAFWVDGMPSDFTIAYPAPLVAYKEASERLFGWKQQITEEDKKPIDENYFKEMFQPALQMAEKWNTPLYCGEYGVIDRADISDTVNWLKDIHAVFDRYGIGRALWTYKVHNFGLTGAHYAPRLEEMVKNL